MYKKLSYKEFEEYYDWLVELLKEKQVNLDLLKEFVEALNNNVIANVNRENNINIDKYKNI